MLRLTFLGHTSGSANSKQIRFYFGGTLIYSPGGDTTTNVVYMCTCYIMRTGSNQQQVNYIAHRGANTINTSNTLTTPEGGGQINETDSSPIVIKITGQNNTTAAANVVFGDLLLVEKLA